MEIIIGHGFAAAERDRVAALYWAAFRRKLRPAFVSAERGLSVVTASLRSDRTLIARSGNDLVGMCGFHRDGAGAVPVTWHSLRASLPWLAAARAALVLSPLARGDVDDTRVLDGIGVDGASRGRGTGTALLEAAVELARSEGLRSVRLSVVDTNPRAEALYRRRGFEQVSAGALGPLSSVYGFDRYLTMERRVDE